MPRRDDILALFDASGFGLEVGPSYNPLLPKREGFRVETIDYADQDELRRKYAENPTVDVSRIEPVDYVSDGRPMRQVIGEGARYDFILASHVIEHTPDMIGFLQDAESLLKPAGVLVLAVPDKRCCFDVFQRLTSTGEVVDVHRAGRSRPSYGSILDAVSNGARQDGETGWPKGRIGDRQLAHSLDQAKKLADASERTGRYTDVHVWRFVPSSFELILHDLFELGETGLRIVSMRETDEFIVVLSREGAGSTRSRRELLAAALEEHAFAHVEAVRVPLQQEIDTLRTRAQGWEACAGKLSLALAQADEEAKRRDAAHDEAKQEIEQLRQEVEALRASTSWRVTRPLRALRGG